MAAINFPASPNVNDTHTHNGKIWKWNGVHWSANTESEGSIQSSWHALGSTNYSSSTSPQYDYKYYRITNDITYDYNRVYEVIIDADDNAGHVAIYHLYLSSHNPSSTVALTKHDRIIMSHVSGKPTMMRVALDSNEHVWIAATQKWGNIRIRGLHENEDVSSMPFADSQLASIPSPQFNQTTPFIWDGDTNTLALMPVSNLNGDFGIGTATPQSELDVNGIIRAGNNTSTGGGTALRVQYSSAGDHTANFGAQYSSGAPMLGYCVESSQSAVDTFVSSADNAGFGRGALVVSHELDYWSAGGQTTTVGNPVTMYNRFHIDSSGNVGIGTNTSTNSRLTLSGDSASVGVAIALDDTNASGKTYGIRSDVGKLIIRDFDESADRMKIDSDGSVNIGNFRIEQGGTGSYLEGVSSIAFRNTTNTWASAANHGIMSTDQTGTFTDDISINSYHDISVRLDANDNHSDGYFRIYKDTTTSSSSTLSHYFGHNTTGLNLSYMSGNVGINTSPRTDHYRLSMSGYIHMNNNNIDYVNQLHFNDNVRFYDGGDDKYLRFKYGNSTEGGIKFYDGDDSLKGYIYGSDTGFGLLSSAGEWAVRIYGNGETQLYHDGSEKLNTKSTGVDITGDLHANGAHGISTNGWLRNSHSAEGLYNETNQNHFYSASQNYWHINTNSSQNHGGLVVYSQHNGTGANATARKGALYFSTSGFGLLDENWKWSFQAKDSEARLCYDGTVKLNTISTGVGVSGNLGVTGGLNVTGAITEGGTALVDKYASKDHLRSLGSIYLNDGSGSTITTSTLIAELEGMGAFDSYVSVGKTIWSYAGNDDLTDAGRFQETAGTSFITWTDNSNDSSRGNITGLFICPTTGASAGKVFIYNDQGPTYTPGWREVWTNTSDGSGSGLDADLLDGQQGSYYLDYNNLTNTPSSGSSQSTTSIDTEYNTIAYPKKVNPTPITLFSDPSISNSNFASTNTSVYWGKSGGTSVTYVVPEFKDFKKNHNDKYKLGIYSANGYTEVIIEDLISVNPTSSAHYRVYWDDEYGTDSVISLYFTGNDLYLVLGTGGGSGSNNSFYINRIDMFTYEDYKWDLTNSSVWPNGPSDHPTNGALTSAVTVYREKYAILSHINTSDLNLDQYIFVYDISNGSVTQINTSGLARPTVLSNIDGSALSLTDNDFYLISQHSYESDQGTHSIMKVDTSDEDPSNWTVTGYGTNGSHERACRRLGVVIDGDIYYTAYYRNYVSARRDILKLSGSTVSVFDTSTILTNASWGSSWIYQIYSLKNINSNYIALHLIHSTKKRGVVIFDTSTNTFVGDVIQINSLHSSYGSGSVAPVVDEDGVVYCIPYLDAMSSTQAKVTVFNISTGTSSKVHYDLGDASIWDASHGDHQISTAMYITDNKIFGNNHYNVGNNRGIPYYDIQKQSGKVLRQPIIGGHPESDGHSGDKTFYMISMNRFKDGRMASIVNYYDSSAGTHNVDTLRTKKKYISIFNPVETEAE